MFAATDGIFIHMKAPIGGRQWSITVNAICEMSVKTINPKLESVPADNHTRNVIRSFLSALFSAKRMDGFIISL